MKLNYRHLLKGLLLLLTIVITGFATMLYFKTYSEECRNLSNDEILSMMQNILHDKLQSSSDGTILFGYKHSSIKINNIRFKKGFHSYDDNYEVKFEDTTNGKVIFGASIFPNCEIQWMDFSD